MGETEGESLKSIFVEASFTGNGLHSNTLLVDFFYLALNKYKFRPIRPLMSISIVAVSQPLNQCFSQFRKQTFRFQHWKIIQFLQVRIDSNMKPKKALLVLSLLIFPYLGESARMMLHSDHQLGSDSTESNSAKIELDKGNDNLCYLKLLVNVICSKGLPSDINGHLRSKWTLVQAQLFSNYFHLHRNTEVRLKTKNLPIRELFSVCQLT